MDIYTLHDRHELYIDGEGADMEWKEMLLWIENESRNYKEDIHTLKLRDVYWAPSKEPMDLSCFRNLHAIYFEDCIFETRLSLSGKLREEEEGRVCTLDVYVNRSDLKQLSFDSYTTLRLIFGSYFVHAGVIEKLFLSKCDWVSLALIGGHIDQVFFGQDAFLKHFFGERANATLIFSKDENGQAIGAYPDQFSYARSHLEIMTVNPYPFNLCSIPASAQVKLTHYEHPCLDLDAGGEDVVIFAPCRAKSEWLVFNYSKDKSVVPYKQYKEEKKGCYGWDYLKGQLKAIEHRLKHIWLRAQYDYQSDLRELRLQTESEGTSPSPLPDREPEE